MSMDQIKNATFYSYHNLAHHLASYDRYDTLVKLLTSFHWLHHKLLSSTPSALLDDYLFLPEDRDLQLIAQAIELSSHIIRQDKRQLGTQLTGRLFKNNIPKVQHLLAQIKSIQIRPWLRPLTPTLNTPGGQLLRTLSGHNDWVLALAVSHDGKRLISSDENNLILWNLETGDRLQSIPNPRANSASLSFTADDKFILTISSKGLSLWEINPLRCVRTFTTETVQCAKLYHYGTGIFGSCKNDIILWDFQSGIQRQVFSGHSGLVVSIVLSPDSKHMISGSKDKTVKIWDIETGNLLNTLEGLTGEVTAIAITPDGKQLVSAAADGTFMISDFATGNCLFMHKEYTFISVITITPDGQTAIVGTNTGEIEWWKLSTPHRIRIFNAHFWSITDLIITADGERMITASRDTSICVWKTDEKALEMQHPKHSNWVTDCAFLKQGTSLLTISDDKSMNIWDTETGLPRNTLLGHSDWIRSFCILEGDEHIVSACFDGTLKVWDVCTGKETLTLEGHNAPIYAVASIPGTDDIISGADDNTLKVWNTKTGAVRHTLSGHTQRIMCIAVTPDGAYAVSGSWDRSAKVWDLGDGRLLSSFEHHDNPIISVIIGPDGHRVYSSSTVRGNIAAWDLKRGELYFSLEAQSGGWSKEYHALCVTSDGKSLISAYENGKILIWDALTGSLLSELNGHISWVNALALSQDNQRLVSASSDASLIVWDLTTSRIIAVFDSDVALFACAISPDGNTVVAADALGQVHFLKLD